MDARWIFTISNRYLTDAQAKGVVEAVDVGGPSLAADLTICDDTTVIASPGVIQRTIIATIGTGISDFYDDATALEDVLRPTFTEVLSGGTCTRVSHGGVDETLNSCLLHSFTVGAGLCP